MQALTATLNKLGERDDGPYLKQLSRHPGQKESRYSHLFSGDVKQISPGDNSSHPEFAKSESNIETEGLEQRVNQLEHTLSQLQQEFWAFTKQFE